MSDMIYPWKRFWCPRTGVINLMDGGFPYDPESYGRYNSDLVSLKSITSFHCLALLGEPGMGKTEALCAEWNALDEGIKAQGHQSLFINLSEYGNEDRLIRTLFDGSEFSLWKQGTHQLHVFIDSFDECLLKIESLVDILVQGFRKCRESVDRLYIRVACRTVVWPISLEECFKDLWKEDQIGVYELAPLRQVDVLEAAKAEEICPIGFLQEITQKNIVPLAIKPVTLKFLLSIYKRHDESSLLDWTLHDLYLEGCKELCVESKDKHRHPQKPLSTLEVGQRLIVAARIAVGTVFANRSTIWTGSCGSLSAGDLQFQELCEGFETNRERHFEVTEQIIWEVLDTGLFSSRGQNRMGWAHKTYAEFLAAWYVARSRLELSEVLRLIVHPEDTAERIIPQLYETVSWLSSMNSEVFSKVIETDPDVLLLSDLTIIDASTKESLVQAVLKSHDQGKLPYHYGADRFRKVEYVGISKLLKQYIGNKEKSINSQYVAIDIVESCCMESVYPILVDVALDQGQPYTVRMRSARVIAGSKNENEKIKLKPLLALDSQDDPDDDLKGYALKSIYPEHMTTHELLNCLTPPKTNTVGSCYQDFIARMLGKKIPDSDLLSALIWLKEQPARRDLRYPFGSFSDDVMMRAWKRLSEPLILLEFSQIVYLRVREYDRVIDSSSEISFSQMVKENTKKRRTLIEAVVSNIKDAKKEPGWLSGHSKYSVLSPLEEDFEWLIRKSKASKSQLKRSIYAKLVRYRIDWTNVRQVNAVIVDSASNTILEEEFLLELTPVVLGSPTAKEQKRRYDEIKEMLIDDYDSKLLEPLPKERVKICLEKFEEGSVDAWWQLCRELLLTPISLGYDERYQTDIRQFPGWTEASKNTLLRVMIAAKEYIFKGDPQNDSWLGQNKVSYSAIGGYRALTLVASKEPDFISKLPLNIWEKWMGIILDYPYIDGKDEEARSIILRSAYEKHSNEFIKVLIAIIDSANAQNESAYKHEEVIRCCWDKRLESAFLDKLTDEKLTPDNFGEILKVLLAANTERAVGIAESYLIFPLPVSKKLREKAVVSAQLLVQYAEDASWQTVWNIVEQDYMFGRAVFEEVSFHAQYKGHVEKKLTASSIADLYVFLFNQYPDIEHAKKDERELVVAEDRLVKPVDSIISWRGYLLKRLQERGTLEACTAIRKIIHALPELKDKLNWRLLEAEALARRQNWQPLKVQEIIRLVANSQPSMLQLSDQVESAKKELSQQMSEEPKISNSGSGNVNVNYGHGGTAEQRIEAEKEKGTNGVAWIGIIATVLIGLFTVGFSGVFNDYAQRMWLDRSSPPSLKKSQPNNSQ